jgi:LemA protein
MFSGNNSNAILENIRNQLETNDPLNAKLSGDLAQWENALSRLMAIAEQYPDLKLSENFRTFMDAILGFEGIIAELRMEYNNSVNEYSTVKDQIPGCVYAFMFQFKDFSYFQVDKDARGFIPIE